MKWSVFFGSNAARDLIESRSAATLPAAEFCLRDGRLFVEWLTGAKEVKTPQRLGNCLLAITLGDATHLLQLRRKAIAPPLQISDTRASTGRVKPCEARIELPYLPNPANLFVEVMEPTGFPPMRCVSEGRNQLPETRVSDNHEVTWYFTEVDYAGLVVDWVRSPQGVVVRAAPGYQLQSTEGTRAILSLADLNRREKIGNRNLKRIQGEHQKRVKQRPALALALRKANAMRARPGELLQHLTARRNQAIAEATKANGENEDRIKTLADHIAKMESDLAKRIPRLKQLAKQIEGAKVHFRFYSLADGDKVILCSNDQNEPTGTAEPSRDRTPNTP